MTPEQHQKLIQEVTDTVRVVVNGKIDRIDKKLDEYIDGDMHWKTTVDSYMTEMMPLKDGVHAIQTLNRFVKWLGLPALGALVVYWYTK